MNSQYKTYSVDDKCRVKQSKKQQGVVLFIALIALVIMSLAAVALIRSVDTSTVIAGNLASKQSATTSADSGLETALIWMASISDLTTFNNDHATVGYYATQTNDPTTFNWNDADSKPASDASGNINASGTDASGNTIRYVIQRMCRVAGEPAAGNCLFGAPAVNTSSQGVRPAPLACATCSNTEQSPIYRVTARVVGVKNTISYIQAFIY